MEEYQQKVSTGNVFIQTQAAGVLYNKIIHNKPNDSDTTNIQQCPEISMLYQSVRSGGPGEASVAAEVLLMLVQDGVLPAVQLLSNLLADLMTALSPASTMQVVTRLMLIMAETKWKQKAEHMESKKEEQVTKREKMGCEHKVLETNNDKEVPTMSTLNRGIDKHTADDFVNPFTGPPIGPVNPYVTLVRKKNALTPLVLGECEYLLFHQDSRIQRVSVSLVRPLLLYAACLGGSEGSTHLLQSLLHLLCDAHCCSPLQHKHVLPALLQAVRLSRSWSVHEVECKVSLLCCLAKLAEHDNDTALQHALLPALLAALPLVQEHGLSCRALLCHVSAAVEVVRGTGCDVSVATLALVLPRVPPAVLPLLMERCESLVSAGGCNPLVGCTVLPAVLQVLSAPCSAAPALTAAASALAAALQRPSRDRPCSVQVKSSQYWCMTKQAFPQLPALVTLVELCNQFVLEPQVATRWLDSISSTGNSVGAVQRLLVTALFLYRGTAEDAVLAAAQALERCLMRGCGDALELFPLLLYRLARDKRPHCRLTLLHMMPSLARNKLCVPLVLKTVFTLWGSTPLRPVLLRVAYDVWRVEPRVYPHLLRLLEEAGTGEAALQGELSIAKAFVIAAVCRDKPSQHGEELLPVLSSLLNQNGSRPTVTYTSNLSSGCDGDSSKNISELISNAVCCLSLEAITSLVSGGVIDLRTSWRVLAPQLAKDRRPEVLTRVCAMLALATKMKVMSDEYESFTHNVLNLLWGWTTHQKTQVVTAAYTALEEFNMTEFRLKMLPPHAKQGIKLPESLAATPFDAAKKPEDVLSYVPGEAWVLLVKGAKPQHWPCLEAFVRSLVRREVAGLYKGIYLTAIQEAKKAGLKGSGGQPEPLKYDFMKDYSTLKATVTFLHLFPKELNECHSKEGGNKILNTLLIYLKALGQPLNRPYPALDWILLAPVEEAVKVWCQKHAEVDWSEKVRHAIFDILTKQCNKSASASTYITKYLVPSSANGLTQKDEICLFGLMDYLGRGIAPSTLQPFISFTLTRYLASDCLHLALLLDAVRPVLTSEFIHDSNRNALGSAIENLNEKLDPSDTVLYSRYKACVAMLPSKHIERLTSPSLWWEVTDSRLHRAAVLRCHVAVNDPEEMALPWLNEIVDSAASLPGERTLLLSVLAETLTVRCSDVESSAWFLQLLGQLLEQTKKKVPDNMVANLEHSQRILFYTDLLVVSLVVWSCWYSSYGVSRLLETPALCSTLLPTAISTLFERPCWENSLPQLLTFLVSSYKYLQPFIDTRYELALCATLMANLCPGLSQQMWNKVVALNLEQSDCLN